MICHRCGYTIKDNQKFCTHCGYSRDKNEYEEQDGYLGCWTFVILFCIIVSIFILICNLT